MDSARFSFIECMFSKAFDLILDKLFLRCLFWYKFCIVLFGKVIFVIMVRHFKILILHEILPMLRRLILLPFLIKA